MGFKENNYILSYKKLMHMLVDYSLEDNDLHHKVGLNWNIVGKIRRNEDISMSSLAQICLYFNCQPSDIVEIKKGSED